MVQDLRRHGGLALHRGRAFVLERRPSEGGRSVLCRVDGEEELLQIYDRALEAGLEVHLITDSGKTEFHGQPTNTCLAIGPDETDKIDAITGHLRLL